MNQAQMNTGVLEGIENSASAAGTTFSDLLLGTYTNPWWLVLMAVTSATTGMVTHWLKAYYREDKSFSFYLWYFKANVKGTVLSVLSMLGALFATFAPLDYTMITAWQVITQAWTIGYAADSFFGTKTKEIIYAEQEHIAAALKEPPVELPKAGQ